MKMEKIELLKILLLENKYPYFSDYELKILLEDGNNDVHQVASKLCLMKADGDKKIKVGPIEIEGPGSEFWRNLSKEYAQKTTINKSSGYNTSIKRADKQ